MMYYVKLLPLLLLGAVCAVSAQTIAPEIVWQEVYKKYSHSDITSVLQTFKGDFVVVGTTQSSSNHSPDIWIGKVGSKGNLLWEHTIIDENDIYAHKLIATAEGGYVVLASIYAVEEKTNKTRCRTYFFKTDQNGTVQWDKTLASQAYAWEEAKVIINTKDNGFLLAGFVKTTHLSKRKICWVAKTDERGNLLWDKHWGDFEGEIVGITESVDGGYTLLGTVKQIGELDADAWLVKIDKYGNKEWERIIGDYNDETVTDVIQTIDGGYAFTGYTQSKGEGKDMWLVKTDYNGIQEWEQHYGGSDDEEAWTLVQTNDGGYALSGWTKSYGAEGQDAWLVKTSAEGKKEWDQAYGKGGDEVINNLIQLNDRGYALAGYSQSLGVKQYAEPYFIRLEGNLNNYYSEVGSNLSSTVLTTSMNRPVLHLLAIGTSAVDLEYTAKDAKDFAAAFKNQGNSLGTGNKLFDHVEITKLVGADATIKNMAASVEQLVYKFEHGAINPQDVLILFLSSHGFLYENELFLQASDYSYKSPRSSSLPFSRLLDDLSQINCKKVVFVDACHSGNKQQTYARKANVNTVNLAIEALSRTNPGITIITSSTGEEQSYEDRISRNGFFTKGILQGFRGIADFNRDDIITLNELIRHLETEVPRIVGQQINKRQTPQVLSHELSDLPIYVVK